MAEVRGTGVQSGELLHVGWYGRNQALEDALDTGVDFVAGDAGSTDCGPGYLGSETGRAYRAGLKQALDYHLSLTVPRKIPFIVGSANMAGTRGGVARFREIVEEIAREKGMHFRAAFIDCELEKPYLKKRLGAGKIRPLDPLPQLTEDDIDRSAHIVGMMGTEPYVKALEEGATVIIGGRTSDAALFAAVPIWKGIPHNVAWHMALCIDHGFAPIEAELETYTSWASLGLPTLAMGIAAADHFRVQATHPNGRVTALRVAQATMFESTHAGSFFEPGGRIDIEQCRYEQLDPRTVKITGSQFTPLAYEVRLEGAERVGYRAFTICGCRDPEIVANLDTNLRRATERTKSLAKIQGIDPDRFRIEFHTYGKGEILRDLEPRKDVVPLEVGIVAECVADTQELANGVEMMLDFELHLFGLFGAGPAVFPFSPTSLEFGPVYQFNVWHLLELDDPLESCDIDVAEL
jgi:hypothetical protein